MYCITELIDPVYYFILLDNHPASWLYGICYHDNSHLISDNRMSTEYWILFFISFSAAFLTTPVFRRLALALDITDHPSARKVHKKPIPYLGGLAFHVSMSASLFYLLFISPYMLDVEINRTELLVLYTVASLFQFVGILDDIYSLSALSKLMIQIILSLVLVFSGFSITQMTSPLGGTIPLGWFGVIVSVFWILTIVNAINFIDGLDGLAAGIVFFAALANLMIALDPWQNFVCIISLILMGATLGFLPYNFSPASIFMGDSGSLYLGVLIAGTALASNVKGATVMSLALPLVILSIPLLDTTLTVIRRGRRRQRIFSADREHIHHRLLRIGYTDRQAVLFVYGLCLLLSMSAYLAAQLSNRYAFVFIFVFLAAILMGLLVFNSIEKRLENTLNHSTLSHSPALHPEHQTAKSNDTNQES